MTGMIIGFLLGAIIIIYTGYVVYRKVKDIKEGKTCCGGSSSCASCSSCKTCPSKDNCNNNS